MPLNKTTNQYADAIDNHLYSEIPKAVFAAIAASALSCGGDWLEDVDIFICKEWKALHAAGIVPQKPTALAMDYAAQKSAHGDGQ